MMTDPIADMLTRIRNAAMARHDRIEMPHSKLKEHVASVMKCEGYLDDVRVSEGDERKTLTLVLRYGRDRQSAIDGLRRVSTPGRRVYVRHDRIDRVLLRHGDLNPQHQPRRHDRPGGAPAACRRRAPLRDLVSAMTTQEQTGEAPQQSRIGKRPIAIPKGVTATLKGRTIEVKGTEGQLSRADPDGRRSSRSTARACTSCRLLPGRDGARLQGLAWALLRGMVMGVADGYTQTLQLVGTGYRAELKGQTLNLALGFSHPIVFPLPQGIKCEIPGGLQGDDRHPHRVRQRGHGPDRREDSWLSAAGTVRRQGRALPGRKGA